MIDEALFREADISPEGACNCRIKENPFLFFQIKTRGRIVKTYKQYRFFRFSFVSLFGIMRSNTIFSQILVFLLQRIVLLLNYQFICHNCLH